jgi:deoxyribodipyrimidine photo-lyase
VALEKRFISRQLLIDHVKTLSPWAEGEASDIVGGRKHAEARLKTIDPNAYSKTRNFGSGAVTRLSPYIHHGVISLSEVRDYVLSMVTSSGIATKLIQELAWRDFWQRVATSHPNWLWTDVEPYKTGFIANDYSGFLPEDILTGNTKVSCINIFIKELINTGYVHNHARMYLASYIVHFRRIKWQIGAAWFLKHLIDGDEASNNFSWQWIASTFSNKPYIFNLENVKKYFGNYVDTSPQNNFILDKSYERLAVDLFPKLER